MQRKRTMAIAAMATLAAVTIGSTIAAGPAAASEDLTPAPVTATTEPYQTTPSAPGGTSDGVVAQASSGYSGGVRKGDDGSWIAYIESPGGFAEVEVGRYKTKREARKAAKAAEDEWNNKGVKADPACDPPFVLC